MSIAAISVATLLRIPMIFGSGETITHLADIPESHRAEYADLGFEEPAIGYKYEYFSIMFLDLWTGGGKVVLFDESSGIRYIPLSEEQIVAISGETADDLGKPFLYRIPVGWFVILGAVGFYGSKMVRDARELG